MLETGVVPRLQQSYRETLVRVANCKIAVPVCDIALITQQAVEEREKGRMVVRLVTLVALLTLEQDLPSRRQSYVAPRGSRHKRRPTAARRGPKCKRNRNKQMPARLMSAGEKILHRHSYCRLVADKRT
jgi:hypothetical protein